MAKKPPISEEFREFLEDSNEEFQEAAEAEKGARPELPPIGTTGKALVSRLAAAKSSKGNPYMLFNFTLQEPEEFQGVQDASIHTLITNDYQNKREAYASALDELEECGLPREIRESNDLDAMFDWFKEEPRYVNYIVVNANRNDKDRKLICQAAPFDEEEEKSSSSSSDSSSSSSSSKEDNESQNEGTLSEGDPIKYDGKDYLFVKLDGEEAVLKSKRLGTQRRIPASELE